VICDSWHQEGHPTVKKLLQKTGEQQSKRMGTIQPIITHLPVSKITVGNPVMESPSV